MGVKLEAGVKLEKVPFEDALRMAGFGKYNVLAFVLCSSNIVAMVFEIYSVSYLVPASACELATSSAHQGLMGAVPLIGIILTSHLWGYMADLKGRRRTLAVTMSMAFITGTLAAFSPNWIVLSVLKLCSCAAVSGAFAMGLTLLSECTVMEKRSVLLLLTTSVFLLSAGVMAVLSIPILSLKFSYYIPYLGIYFNAWRTLALMFSFPCLVGALGVYCSCESPKYLLGAGRHEEALAVLRGIFEKNTGKNGLLYQVNSIVLDEENKEEVVGLWASMKTQTLPLFKPPLLKATLLLSMLMFIVYLCINPYQVWMPFIVSAAMQSVEAGHTNLTLCQMIRLSRNNGPVLEESNDCSMNQFGMMVVFSINVAIGAISLVFSGVTPFVGRKALFIGLQLIGGAAAIYINLSYNWIVSAVCFMVYLAGVINFGTLTSYCVEVYPTYLKATAVSLTLMVGRGSAIMSINLVKRLLNENCEAGFYIFGTIFIVGGLIAIMLPTDKQIFEHKNDLRNKHTNIT